MEIFNYPNCCVCGSSKFDKKFEFKYSSNIVLNKLNIKEYPKTFIVVCKECEHNFVHPQLNNILLAKYYGVLNSEFFDLDNLPKIDYLSKEHFNVRRLVEKNSSNGKILEIGCGYGYLISGFKSSKWKKYAVEPSPHAAKFVKDNFKVNVQNKKFEDTTFNDNSFDVIMLFDVIEHLQNPQLVFEKLKKVIRPGGYVYIGTGNIQSLNARISGSNWAYFGSWEHISFFSKNSIERILSKNNFELIEIIKRSHKKGYKNYWKFFKNILKAVLKYLNMTKAKNELAFDHVTIVARKVANK